MRNLQAVNTSPTVHYFWESECKHCRNTAPLLETALLTKHIKMLVLVYTL